MTCLNVVFRRGKGDKDVKKEFKKTSPTILDFVKIISMIKF